MIACIEKTGYINDAQYAKLVKRAKATRSLDFNKLIEFGKIQRCGKGKNTYYKAK
jgi:Fic family protein